MTNTPPDDLDAVRTIVTALQAFEASAQERILRWSREKLGLAMPDQPPPTAAAPLGHKPPEHSSSHEGSSHTAGRVNIREFVNTKNPRSDNQFAATVAYYYRFEAPETERKDAITSSDLLEACRRAGRERMKYPAQTLVNSHSQGYLDKTGEKGAYAVNNVGENLVAMTLPEGSAIGRKAAPSRSSGKRKPPAKRPAKKTGQK